MTNNDKQGPNCTTPLFSQVLQTPNAAKHNTKSFIVTGELLQDRV